MNLKYLKDAELDARIKNLAQREREILCEILLAIKEIDQRKLYLEFGYPNLFAYLTQAIGYSEGSAQRRIDASRLMKEVPEVAQKIQSGEIVLQQVSLLQKSIRARQKISGKKVTLEDKKTLLTKMRDQSFRESEITVSQFFDLPLITEIKEKKQQDQSVRLEMTLSLAQYEKLQKARALLAHSLPATDWVSFLEYVAGRIIQQKSKKLDKAHSAQTIRKDQPCCQYIDPQSGKQCSSTWYLEVDHKQAKWSSLYESANGKSLDEAANLQLLCSAHNKLKYRKEQGIRFKT